jgi:hypothetical protein
LCQVTRSSAALWTKFWTTFSRHRKYVCVLRTFPMIYNNNEPIVHLFGIFVKLRLEKLGCGCFDISK